MRIGILGGGISGLSSGYFLKKKGVDFEVLERDDRCGGLCKSTTLDGFTFDDVGGHIFFTKDGEVMELVLKLLGENKNKVRRNTKIFFKNRFVKYPFENGLSDLPEEDNKECLEEFLKIADKTFDKPKNFEEWIIQTFGKGIADKYMIPYNKKIWNFPPSKMATFWIADRVPKPPKEDIIKSSQGISTEGYTHQLYFWYPIRGGFEVIPKVFEGKIKENVVTGFEIKSVKNKDGKWEVSNGNQIKMFDKLISTVPIYHLVEALGEIPEEVREALNNLKYNSVMVLALGFDQPEKTDRTWLYIPDINITTHRLIYLDKYTSFSSPEGKSLIMSEITYNKGDDVDKLKDKDIIDKTVDQLHELGLIDKTNLCFSKLVRTPYAYVVYDLDYEKNIKIVRNYFDKIGIELVGRFSEFKYYNSDGCIRASKTVVDKLFP